VTLNLLNARGGHRPDDRREAELWDNTLSGSGTHSQTPGHALRGSRRASRKRQNTRREVRYTQSHKFRLLHAKGLLWDLKAGLLTTSRESNYVTESTLYGGLPAKFSRSTIEEGGQRRKARIGLEGKNQNRYNTPCERKEDTEDRRPSRLSQTEVYEGVGNITARAMLREHAK